MSSRRAREVDAWTVRAPVRARAEECARRRWETPTDRNLVWRRRRGALLAHVSPASSHLFPSQRVARRASTQTPANEHVRLEPRRGISARRRRRRRRRLEPRRRRRRRRRRLAAVRRRVGRSTRRRRLLRRGRRLQQHPPWGLAVPRRVRERVRVEDELLPMRHAEAGRRRRRGASLRARAIAPPPRAVDRLENPSDRVVRPRTHARGAFLPYEPPDRTDRRRLLSSLSPFLPPIVRAAADTTKAAATTATAAAAAGAAAAPAAGTGTTTAPEAAPRRGPGTGTAPPGAGSSSRPSTTASAAARPSRKARARSTANARTKAVTTAAARPRAKRRRGTSPWTSTAARAGARKSSRTASRASSGDFRDGLKISSRRAVGSDRRTRVNCGADERVVARASSSWDARMDAVGRENAPAPSVLSVVFLFL